MSDAEIIASFCEARPTPEHFDPGTLSVGGWWWTNTKGKWVAWDCDSLDRLHLVEAKLTEKQRRHYCILMFANFTPAHDLNPIQDHLTGNRWAMLNATAEQKLKALAAVLRGAGAAH